MEWGTMMDIPQIPMKISHSQLQRCFWWVFCSSSCHIEHQGKDANLRVMDHEILARLGDKIIGDGQNEIKLDKSHLPANHPLVSERVAQLNCAGCHSTKDKHFGLMG